MQKFKLIHTRSHAQVLFVKNRHLPNSLGVSVFTGPMGRSCASSVVSESMGGWFVSDTVVSGFSFSLPNPEFKVVSLDFENPSCTRHDFISRFSE